MKTVINNWKAKPSKTTVFLTGDVVNHPKLQDGPIETSELAYIDVEQGIVKTMSGTEYVLGSKFNGGLSLDDALHIMEQRVWTSHINVTIFKPC